MDVHPEFYNPYLANVPEGDIVLALKENGSDCVELFDSLSEEDALFRYAPDKWSLKEILGHLIDSERVFAYRALAFARGDNTPLPGFEENDYAERSNAHQRTLDSLRTEFRTLRLSTVQLFAGLDTADLESIGTMSGNKASVKSIGRIIAGHCMHHLKVIHERYLPGLE